MIMRVVLEFGSGADDGDMAVCSQRGVRKLTVRVIRVEKGMEDRCLAYGLLLAGREYLVF